MFDKIECEWPLFFCYLVIDYYFQGNKELAAYYADQLEKVTYKLLNSIQIHLSFYCNIVLSSTLS